MVLECNRWYCDITGGMGIRRGMTKEICTAQLIRVLQRALRDTAGYAEKESSLARGQVVQCTEL